MNIQTKRLRLVPMTVKDLDIFHRTNTNSFVKHFLWDNEEISKSLSKDILIEIEARFKEEKWGLWKLINAENEDYMGYIGFWFFFEEKLPQLLYALLPQHTGNGYATEASREIINYAFNELSFDYITASMDAPNQASVNVCNRLNMRLIDEKEIEGKPTLFFKRENNDKASSV